MKKYALIIISTYKPRADELAQLICAFLTEHDFVCEKIYYDGLNSVSPLDKVYQLAISLGGDGTVLFTARLCVKKNIPIFAVNLGRFGFIAPIDPDLWQETLSSYLDTSDVKGSSRMMLSASVIREGSCVASFNALNDVVISGNGIAKLLTLEVLFNTIPFGTYRADGVIVSTPTGSTAYSVASGGPILDPSVDAFVLTPVSAFSLSNRPIVLPASGQMSIKILPMRQKNTIVSIDGQELFSLQEGDCVTINECSDKIYLIAADAHMFYQALRSQLAWSGSSLPLLGDEG